MNQSIRQIRHRLTHSLTVGLLALLTMQCHDKHELISIQSTGCQISSQTVEFTGSSSDKYTNTWTYNAAGQLTIFDGQNVGSFPALREAHSYDANGFLIRTISTKVVSGIASFVTLIDTTRYTYATGRLVKELTSGTFSYRTITTTHSYDEAGLLTKSVLSDLAFDTKKTSIYTAGKQTDFILRSNGAETHPYTFSDGRIIKNGQISYEYDSQGRISRTAEIGRAFTNEYTDGKAFFEAQSLPKGWPDELRSKFNYDQALDGLPVHVIRYKPAIPGTGSLYKNMETLYTYTKNAQGFPLRSEHTTTAFSTLNGDVVGTPRPIIETFTYANCP